MSTFSNVLSQTDTYTAARAKQVMKSVLDDFIGLTDRKFITIERAIIWRDNIIYALDNKSLLSFEIQFSKGTPKGYLYIVDSTGTLISNDKSGGIDYYNYENGTQVSLLYRLDENSNNYKKVLDELVKRGVGTNGVSLANSTNVENDRTYSKEGFGLKRQKIL